MEERTLSIKPPFGGTLVFTMLVFLTLWGAGEWITGTRIFQSRFIAVSRGSPHFQFELQLGRLESIVAADGFIDCIFLGNSMVWLGFDPAAFTRAYQERTGDELRCYNFGVDGLPVTAASGLKQYLMKKYHPKLLIYGTDARDFAVAREERDASVIMDEPWMKFHLGHFTLKGWLYEHSNLYPYLQTFGYLLRMDKQYLFVREPGHLTSEAFGFYADETVGAFVTSSPALHQDMGPVRYYYSLLSDFQMLPENTSSFQEILKNDQEDTSVVVVVMPVPDTYQDFFSTNPQGYQIYLEHVQETAQRFGSNVLIAPNDMIPENGWVDYTHLNTTGAEAFSNWLGQQLGEAVSVGQILTFSR